MALHRSTVKPQFEGTLGYLAGLAILVFPLATANAVPWPPCPACTLNFGGLGPFSSTAPVIDSTEAGYPDFRVAYDLRHGTIAMSQGGLLAQTYVDAVDLYDVVGVPAGTPVSLTAQLSVDGMVWTQFGCGGSGCGGYVTIHLGAGATATDTTYSFLIFNGSRSFHDVRSLPVTLFAGTPVQIDFRLGGARSPGGNHLSSASGLLTFTGLPPGATIVSCQGYGSLPVPAKRASWGSVKAIYR